MGLLRRLAMSTSVLIGGLALTPLFIVAGWTCAITDGIISTFNIFTAPIVLSLQIALNRNHAPIQLADPILPREPLLAPFGLTKRLIYFTQKFIWKSVFQVNVELIASAPKNLPMPPVSTLATEADPAEFLKA